MQDVHFDGLAQTFSDAVYETSRGFIRLGVLWEDLCQAVPQVESEKLNILDVGGGMGQIAHKLARLGHTVTLADPSEEMLTGAREVIGRERLENVTLICSDAQTLAQHVSETFDLVICHAVLEWVASPEDLIGALAPFLKPGGKLSLMFLNGYARVFKAVIRGDFETFSSPEKAKAAEGNPPQLANSHTLSGARGLSAEMVINVLNSYDLSVQSKAGIRIFHDHIPEHLKKDKLSELLQVELNYRHTEPFMSLAQHIHLICSHKAS